MTSTFTILWFYVRNRRALIGLMDFVLVGSGKSLMTELRLAPVLGKPTRFGRAFEVMMIEV